VPEQRICWVVVSQLAILGEAEKTRFRNSTWGSESHGEMIDDVKDFRVPGCGTLGNLINHTPKENISRVFWEEKLFETWTHGRTVLIGDAAHKVQPLGCVVLSFIHCTSLTTDLSLSLSLSYDITAPSHCGARSCLRHARFSHPCKLSL